MADEKPLTEERLVAALKQAGFPTKQDVEDIVHQQLSEFHANMTVPEINQLRDEVRQAIGQVNSRLNSLKGGQSHLKDEIKGLLAELSTTPSRAQFEKLKARVDKYLPATYG